MWVSHKWACINMKSLWDIMFACIHFTGMFLSRDILSELWIRLVTMVSSISDSNYEIGIICKSVTGVVICYPVVFVAWMNHLLPVWWSALV